MTICMLMYQSEEEENKYNGSNEMKIKVVMIVCVNNRSCVLKIMYIPMFLWQTSGINDVIKLDTDTPSGSAEK